MPDTSKAPTPPVRQTASVSGHQISSLERGGTDPPILLLHGWGASAAGFTGLLRLSRTPRRLLALDLPGFGESPLGQGDWSTAAYAELVRRLVHQRGWSEISLLGHSYGGGVAIRLAGEPGLGLDRAILCAASGARVPGWRGASARGRLFRGLRLGAESLLPQSWSQVAVDWLRQRLGSEDYRRAGPLRPVLVRAVSEDLTELARRISVPTLITWGAGDRELPLDPFGWHLRRSIAGSEMVQFQRSGHFPFLDEPRRFAAVFDSFVDAKL